MFFSSLRRDGGQGEAFCSQDRLSMDGLNDIQVAFSTKSLKVAWMHGKLTQQDSVRADREEDTRFVTTGTIRACGARKSAREKRSR